MDIVIASDYIGLKNIKELNLKGIKRLEPFIARNNLYHYLHKKHKNLVPRITAVLQEMEKEGVIQQISEQTVTQLLSGK